MRTALAVSPIASLVNAAVPGPAKVLISSIARDPGAGIARRAMAVKTFREVCVSLEPYRARRAGSLASDSPALVLNSPSMHVLVKRNGHVDPSIVEDIARWMSIAGDIPQSGALPPREKAAESSLEEWHRWIADRNAKTIERVGRVRSSEEGVACWAKTKAEIDAGWLTAPVRLTPSMGVSLSLSPRFAIFEEMGDGPKKVRVVGDMRASGVNAGENAHDTAAPDSFHCAMALAVYFRSLSPGFVLQAASADFCHAYKTICILPGHEGFPVMLFPPPEGPLMVSNLRAQPFGSKRDR